ncbi:hypothetical protein [Metabacillus sp. Hm71]|uniref:hypothetical protein n=1 Tax=Metabacillus sp. Hm71 TaxID=3450743 RepID=UPI003F42E673
MFENEDIILPDDYQEALPQAEETFEETVDEQEPVDTGFESEEDTTPSEQTEDAETQGMTEEQKAAFLKVKYNKEELELDEEKARELAQKGLNYDKLQERLQALETDPRLSFVETQAKKHNMSVEEYLQAVEQAEYQDRINELVQKGISEEVAEELLENRKFRQQYESEQKAKAEEEKRNVEFQDFFAYFNQVNNRDFVPGKDEIPQQVWDAHQNGVPLKYAYMEHYNNELKTQMQILKQNKENEKRAPIGSVTSHGSTETASEDDFLKGFNSI